MNISVFNKKVKKLESEFFRSAWGSETPTLPLFHHTSAQGLAGILSTGELWATDITYMDDEKELSYGNEFINSKFHAWAATLPVEYRDFVAAYEPSLYALRGHFNFYAVCLTEHEADEEHIQSYGDYALGFDMSDARADSILQVIYNPDRQEVLAQEILNASGKFLAELYRDKVEVQSRKEFKRCWSDFIVIMQKALAMLTLRFKRESYLNDKEWRYLGTGDPEGMRDCSGRTILYQHFRLDQIGQLSKIAFRSDVAQPSSFLEADVLERVRPLLPA